MLSLKVGGYIPSYSDQAVVIFIKICTKNLYFLE